jgi:type 1 glutamine amidotransferase
MRPGVIAAAVLAMAGTAACTSPDPAPAPAADVLVFTRTAGFRHDSIPAGLDAVRAVAAAEGLAVTATEDPAQLAGLDRYAAVVFLNTSGEVLDAGSRAALEAYVRGGGGWLGVHAAADTEYGWPFYGELVGARFARHPPVQPLTVRVDRDHPATAQLPAAWRVTDEPYDFRARPGAGVRVLARLEESSYRGGGMGADHPITWCHRVGAGRSFYTGLGHPTELYADPGFRGLLRGGLSWAAGKAAGSCGPAS